jgi:DNA repair protein RadC
MLATHKQEFDINLIEEVQLVFKPTIPNSIRPLIKNSNFIYEMVIKNWEGVDHFESFKILLVNRANRVLGIKTIGIGAISGCIADPRLIFQTAILANASGIVLIHNHPSGNLKPSQADRNITNKIQEAGKLLDIVILDHIILTSESYYSFADEGEL